MYALLTWTPLMTLNNIDSCSKEKHGQHRRFGSDMIKEHTCSGHVIDNALMEETLHMEEKKIIHEVPLCKGSPNSDNLLCGY